MNRSKLNKLIKDIHVVLQTPATSWQEVANRVSTRRDEVVPLGRIHWAVARLRKNPEAHGFNIMHVTHGVASAERQGRIFRLSTDARSIPEKHRVHARFGSLSLLREARSKQANQAGMLTMIRPIVSPALGRHIEDQIIMIKASNVHLTTVIEALEVELAAEAA